MFLFEWILFHLILSEHHLSVQKSQKIKKNFRQNFQKQERKTKKYFSAVQAVDENYHNHYILYIHYISLKK